MVNDDTLTTKVNRTVKYGTTSDSNSSGIAPIGHARGEQKWSTHCKPPETGDFLRFELGRF